MPKYVIERETPGVGNMSPEDLRAGSAKSAAALRELGPDVQWLHSYVTDNKIYCVYVAKNPELVREHARLSGFPADKISEVRSIIDPSTVL